MSILKGDKATEFIAWLACIKGFLPKSMTIEEASDIFLRRCAEREKEEESAKNSKSP